MSSSFNIPKSVRGEIILGAIPSVRRCSQELQRGHLRWRSLEAGRRPFASLAFCVLIVIVQPAFSGNMVVRVGAERTVEVIC